MTEYQLPTLFHKPNLIEEAQARQDWNEEFGVDEPVVHIDPVHKHTRPAILSQQPKVESYIEAFEVDTESGYGTLPVMSSRPLLISHPGITDLYVVTHGVMRNASDYFHWAAQALGKKFDRSRIMIVAPQFPAEVDPIDAHTLRWGFNEWRGAEPARKPSPAISSFDAKDALMSHLASTLPNLRTIHIRSNSEGAQQDNRWLAFSGVLQKLEYNNIAIEAQISNPGTLLYYHPIRPDVESARYKGGWKEIPADSPANRWPYGMSEAPPYIRNRLRYISLETAIGSYLSRTVVCAAEYDDDPNGSQLPDGPGPQQQGRTRKDRAIYNTFYLHDLRETALPELPYGRLVIVPAVGHAALDNFIALEAGKMLNVGYVKEL